MLDSNYPLLPDRRYGRELRRPWKLVTFALGMTWLIYGAVNYEIGDWDIGVSVVMGTLTYVLAPWSVFVIGSAALYRPRCWLLHVLLALLVAVFVVDTSYVVYHTLVGNPMYREDNFRASIALYFLAGMAWLYRGSFKELLRDIVLAVRP